MLSGDILETCVRTKLCVWLGYILAIITIIRPALGRDPTFDVPVVNVTVVSGQRAVLPCTIDDLGKKKVTWTDQNLVPLTFEKERIVDDIRFSIVRLSHKEWNLLIQSVQRNDEGQYRCTINTKPVQSKVVTLHVKESPQIIDELSSNDVTVPEGSTVILNCNVTGVPPPEVTWFRKSASANHRDRESKTCQHTNAPGLGATGNVIIITNVTRYCDDVYECVADNNVPPAVSRQMRVTVEFAPEIQLRNKIMRQEAGKKTILDCLVTANPLSVNYWEKDGKTIHETEGRYHLDAYDEYDRTVTLSLTLVAIDADVDYGAYKCIAQNKQGADSETMRLLESKSVATSTTTRSTTLRDKTPPIETPGVYTIISGTGDRSSPGHGSEGSHPPNTGGWTSGCSGQRQVFLQVFFNSLLLLITLVVST